MKRLKSAVWCLSIFTLTSTTLTFAHRNSPGHSGRNEKQVSKKRMNAGQGTKPEWGTSVKATPAKTTTIKSKQNMTYHYREGVYYQPAQGCSYKVGRHPWAYGSKYFRRASRKYCWEEFLISTTKEPFSATPTNLHIR